MIPWVDDETVTATEKSRSYPFPTIIGMRIGPIDEVSATLDPEIPPKNIDATTLTIASPPRIVPTARLARSMRRRAIPPVAMISPQRMKNGIASNVGSAIWAQIF